MQEKLKNIFIVPIQGFPQVWSNDNLVFFFICSNMEEIVKKIGENKIGGLISRTREIIN